MSDDHGRVVLCFSMGESLRDGHPWADGVWVPPSVSTERAGTLAIQAMPGWILSTSDRSLAHYLLTADARERRHAHSMSSPLSPLGERQPIPSGLHVEPLSTAQVDRHALTLGALNLRAYPAHHPDAFAGDEAAAVSEVRAIARGELLGPMMPESRIALLDGRIVGACFVVDRPGEPPFGGPWVIDLFRDPRVPVKGIGAALLTFVMMAAREARLPGLSLVVSHDNTKARHLYEQLGFVDVEESWTLVLPKKTVLPQEDERPG